MGIDRDFDRLSPYFSPGTGDIVLVITKAAQSLLASQKAFFKDADEHTMFCNEANEVCLYVHEGVKAHDDTGELSNLLTKLREIKPEFFLFFHVDKKTGMLTSRGRFYNNPFKLRLNFNDLEIIYTVPLEESRKVMLEELHEISSGSLELPLATMLLDMFHKRNLQVEMPMFQQDLRSAIISVVKDAEITNLE